jgi:hypothetical protein
MMALPPVHPASSSTPSARISQGRHVAVVSVVAELVVFVVVVSEFVSVVVTW